MAISAPPPGTKLKPTMPGPDTTSDASPARSDHGHAAPAAQRRRHINVARNIDRHALRPSQAAMQDIDVTIPVDRVDRVVARRCWSGHVQRSIRTKRQVIRCDARLQRRENEDLPVRCNLEDGPAAVADIEILVRVERQSRWPRPCLPHTRRTRHFLPRDTPCLRAATRRRDSPRNPPPGRWRS